MRVPVSLPASLSSLPLLLQLSLDAAYMDRMPQGLSSLGCGLRVLRLRSRKLDNLPDSLNNLYVLGRLELRARSLTVTAAPELSLGFATGLRHLSLQLFPQVDVGREMADLPELRELERRPPS